MLLGYCEVVEDDGVVYCSDLSYRELVFSDRFDGGSGLARLILDLGIVSGDMFVFGLVAGGVPVAYAVSRELKIPFDVVIVKKILFPWTTEAGFGAVAPDGSFMYDEYIAHHYLGYSRELVRELVSRTRDYVVDRTLRIRGSLEYGSLKGYDVLIVDDGIATGYTMTVASIFLRRLGANKVIAASPTGCSDGVSLVSKYADLVVVVNLRNPPYAVADAYIRWYDLSDEDVIRLLERASSENLYRRLM